MMYNLRKVLNVGLALGLFATICVPDAQASALTDALINRPGFTYDPGNSYDGPGRDSLSFFSSFGDGNIYELGTIASQTVATTYTSYLISELACFSGDDANFQGAFTNKFGHQDVGGTFVESIDSDNINPVASASFTQDAGKDFDFALKSPEGLFYGKDSKNIDGGSAHMLAIKVTNAGTINIGESTLFGNGPISFNLEVGDVVLFMEDMKFSGNTFIPMNSDFDYNDMVVVLRASAIPEPATMALLGLGVLRGVMRKIKVQV